MKAILIVPAKGPNPEHDPPRRSDFEPGEKGDLAHADARALYDVPADLDHAPGLVIEGAGCWVHCVPDMEVQFDGQGRPVRFSGVIRAEPADEACQAAVNAYLERMARAMKRPVADLQKALAKRVEKLKQANPVLASN